MCDLKIDTVEVRGSNPLVPTISLTESARTGASGRAQELGNSDFQIKVHSIAAQHLTEL